MNAALELSQVAEELGYAPGAALRSGVEPHERIEDQKPRPELIDELLERLAVGRLVEAKGVGGDDVDRERGELEAGSAAEGFGALADRARIVLGGVEQHRSRDGHVEVPHGRRP